MQGKGQLGGRGREVEKGRLRAIAGEGKNSGGRKEREAGGPGKSMVCERRKNEEESEGKSLGGLGVDM